jgi:hypothetical protein
MSDVLTDKSIASFLASRRKLIAGLLGIAGVIVTANLGHELDVRTVVESIVGFLGVYGVHEVENT